MRETLPWLCDVLEHGRRDGLVSVGFGLSYDVNMLVGDLNREALADLWASRPVRWEAYTIHYIPRKWLRVHQECVGPRGGRRMRGGTLFDVYGFFQSSFVDALRAWGADPALVARIAAMKARRGTFTAAHWAEVRSYCVEECRALSWLMDRFRVAADDAGLRLTSWHGAGAAAGALLRREGVHAHQAPEPPRLHVAVRCAYFGGRIEMPLYGVLDRPIYRYDIRSAYPHALAELPSLAAGTWDEIDPPAPSRAHPFALYRVSWDFASDAPAPCYPFPWRAPTGAIRFPSSGEGWYWAPEVAAAYAALRAGVVRGRLDVREAWTWTPADPTARPFGFVPQLYQLRARWKREGRAGQKVLKLALNSLYGKTAGQAGARGGRPPRHHQLSWAGWVTSRVRARLYHAALPAIASGALVQLATDAIYTTAPLALGGDGLGSWEPATYAGGVFVQSGVYWTRDDSGAWAECCRGFDPGTLHLAEIIAGYRSGRPSVDATSTRFVGMGQALHGQQAAWRSWVTAPRRLQLHPPRHAKRYRVGSVRGATAWYTFPTDRPASAPRQSAPAPLEWAPLWTEWRAQDEAADAAL